MANDNDYDDLDEGWEADSDSSQDDSDDTSSLLESIGNKDARRRLDDLLEERRLKHEMEDDFFD